MGRIKRLNRQDREKLYAKAKAYGQENTTRIFENGWAAEIGNYEIVYVERKETPSFHDLTRVKLITSRTMTISSISPQVRQKFFALHNNDTVVMMKCLSNRACRELLDTFVRLNILDEIASV